VAVHPRSGAAWVNADVLFEDGRIDYAAFFIGAGGEVRQVGLAPPELLFARYDARGRWFAIEDHAGELWVRVERDGHELARRSLGPRPPLDFAQDLHFAEDGTAVVAFWSGRVELLRLVDGRIERRAFDLAEPPECRPPEGRGVVYSAFLHGGDVWATLACGAVILRRNDMVDTVRAVFERFAEL